MSNTNSSEVEIIQNVYKFETDQEKNENSSNNEIKIGNNDNLNKTVETFIPIEVNDSKKGGDKINAKDARRDFVVYGYYVREPIWVNMQFGGGGGGGGESYDPQSRNPFVCLVFIIVFTMIIATIGWGGMCMQLQALKNMYRRFGVLILIAAMILMVAMSYAMACSPCTRVMPCNIICLVLAVIGMSLIVGYFAVKFHPMLILFALIATAAVVVVCILLALTNFDFTQWLLYIIVIMVVLSVLFMCIMIGSMIMGESFPILTLVLLIISTLVHAVMLTIEIQMVLGGKAVELEENDYAFAAYMIYTSVIDLFIKLVQIFGIIDMLMD